MRLLPLPEIQSGKKASAAHAAISITRKSRICVSADAAAEAAPTERRNKNSIHSLLLLAFSLRRASASSLRGPAPQSTILAMYAPLFLLGFGFI